jgi:FkbM family methyltransferase
MNQRISDGLVALYARVLETGLLNRPRAQRAFEAAYMTYKGLLEAGPINGLSTLVSNGSTIFDVGANIGFFSVRFARWVGPDGKVIAIEPEARNVESLRRRIELAGMADIVECVPAAAADKPGELRLAITRGHPADHHLSDSGVLIPAVTLDDLAAEDPRPVSLIKIDVQGAEAMVVAGARELIETHRPAIFVEIDAPSLARSGSSPRELIEILTEIGYRPHQLTRHGVGGVERPSELVSRAATGYIDVLFIWAERPSW